MRQTSANKVMASIFWNSKGIFLVEILETDAKSIRAMYGHIKKVKITNQKGSAKQEDESGPLLA